MVVNETINATAVVPMTGLDILKDTVTNQLIPRFMELVRAPYDHSNLLWITIPLITSLIVMDIYFGRYKKEELGWNTAVGNTLALMFVSMDLIRHLYTGLAEYSFGNMLTLQFKGVLVVLVLALGSLWLFVAEFFHLLPKRFAFLISSSLPTSMFAYLAIVLIYTDIPLDKFTFIAAFLLAIVLFIILKIIHWFIPTYHTREEIQLMLAKERESKQG